MVDGELFDKLALLGSKLRKNAKPFGGIQVSEFSGRLQSTYAD
jgi:hypothetical protein